MGKSLTFRSFAFALFIAKRLVGQSASFFGTGTVKQPCSHCSRGSDSRRSATAANVDTP